MADPTLTPSPTSMGSGTALVWIEVLSCTIASMVVLTFFLARYQRWHANPVIKLLLFASAALADKMLPYTLGIMQSAPYDNELHLTWAAFLVIAYGSLSTSVGYGVYIDRKERWAFEISQLLDGFYVARLIASFPIQSKFTRPLWALLCLIMVKCIQRIIGFGVANRQHGTKNIDVVADHMSYEHELTDYEVDPIHMNGYKYLVVGEDKANTKPRAPDYLRRVDVVDKKVITIEKVWQCQGRLLCSGGELGGRLKDVCLSFALFKLLRRRFFDHSAAEAEHVKTHRFVFEGLLKEEDHERVFRVIKVELEFLHDLFCTKYPIIFGRWFLTFCLLQLSIITISAWTAVSALHKYRTNGTDRIVDGKNVDVIITYVLVILIMIMEAWEFCSYWLSDWAKVTFICNYVKHPKPRDFVCLDKVLGIICRGKLWRPLSDKIGQYSLLENLICGDRYIPCNVTCGFKAGKKRKRVVKLSEGVKKAIFASLRSTAGAESRLSNGEFSLRRNEVSAAELIPRAGEIRSPVHTIMIWHIATSCFEMIESTSTRNVEHRKVATTLSRYCAYLLVFAPELLPVCSSAIKDVLEVIVSETRIFFEGCKSKEQMCNKMQTEGSGDRTIIGLGAELAKRLTMHVKAEEQRWKVLADFWAELILFLAPSDNANAHKETLAKGGEFITHLWALLYHAGILERPKSSWV